MVAAKTATVSRAKVIAISVLVLAGLTASLIGWWAWTEHAAIASDVPVPPDLSAWPEPLQQRVAAADRGARGYVRPARALRELARLYHANGFFDEAIACYETLQQSAPTDALWPHLHASILATNGQLEEAAPLYRRAVELAPTYLPAQLRLGDVLLKANHTAEAARAYRGVLARQRDEPYALLGLARCAIGEGSWEAARQQLLDCAQVNPEFVGGLSLLATVHDHFGETAQADAVRERINKREFVDLLDPWVEALLEDCYDPYRLSVAAAVAGFRDDHGSAERWLLKAIELAPKPAPYYRQLAKLQTWRKDYTAARQSFAQAVALAPSDSDAWTLLVGLLKTTGDRTAAYQTVVRGLENCPESRGLHFAYGQMLSEDGRFPQAIVELQQAKRIAPTEVNAYVELALVHFKLGEIEAGMDEMRAALAVQPDHPVALVMLARDAIARGDRAVAQDWIRRARLQRRVRPEDLQGLVAQFSEAFRAQP